MGLGIGNMVFLSPLIQTYYQCLFISAETRVTRFEAFTGMDEK